MINKSVCMIDRYILHTPVDRRHRKSHSYELPIFKFSLNNIHESLDTN